MLIVYFCFVDETFLHTIDLKTLSKELEMSTESIGRFLQMKNPKGVYNWSKDKSAYGTRPSYNDIIRLLQKGATVETLFGVEYKGHVQNSSVTPPAENSSTNSFMESPEFKAKLAQSIKELKAKGVI